MSHAWMPRSGCDESCARAPREARVGPVRHAARLATVALVVAASVPLALLGRGRGRAAWGRALIGACGARVRVVGTAPAGAALVVANHVSWLDVPALAAVAPVRMVAKAEVRAWPVAGRVAAAAGAVFLDRERLRSLPAAVGAVATALRGGDPVGVFPEGTTWCGRASGRFRAAAFQAAIDTRAPVVPVRLRFTAAGAPTATPAYVGAPSLAATVARTAALRDLVVEVLVLPPIDPRSVGGRRELARAAELAVRPEPAFPLPAAPAPHVPARSVA